MIDAVVVHDTQTNASEILVTNGHTSILLKYEEADSLQLLLRNLLQDIEERRMNHIGQNGNDGEHYEYSNAGRRNDGIE